MLQQTRITLACLGVMLGSVTIPACGDGDDGSKSEPAWQSAITACNAYCDAQQTSCGIYSSADECKATECDSNSLMLAPADCQEAAKAYYDCLNGVPNVCDPSACSEQLTAVISAC